MSIKKSRQWFVGPRKLFPIHLLLVVVMALLAGLPFTSALADSSGTALEFDGVNDYVRLVRTNTMMGGTTWSASKTITLWVKPTGATSPAVQPQVGQLIVGNDFPRAFGLTRATNGGNDKLWVWNWDSSGVDRIGIGFTLDEWVHIAIVHDNGTLSVYKNGLLVGSVVSGSTVISGSSGDGTLFLGGSGRSGSTTYFAGQIDEVRFWNGASDQATITDWMTEDLTADHPNWNNLAANYQMSDGSGTSLTDNSGHGHTGSLLGGMSNANWVVSTAFGPADPVEPNDPPTANAQTVMGDEDMPINITLTGSDPNDHPLTYSIVAQPNHGVVSGTPPDLVYTPSADFYGADSFAFVVNDGFVDSPSALVDILINSVNDQPVAEDDSVTTLVDTQITIQVLGNDTDVDGDLLTISGTSAAANGVVVNSDSGVTYTPNQGYVGTDSFSYTIIDGNSGTGTAQVHVTVNAEAEPPPNTDAGYALAFDGNNDFVRLARTNDILGSGWETSHTVSLWVKPTEPAVSITRGPAWCDAIFGDRPRWWGISHCIINGYDRIWVWNYDGNYDLIGVTYGMNEWVHITLMHSGGQLTAYRNGMRMGSMATGPTSQPSTGAFPVLQIGAVINNASRNWSFGGEIDEVSLWNLPLTESQIERNMYHLLAGNEPGLGAYYQMSDGAGAILTDDSVNSWDGTLEDGLLPEVPPDGAIEWVISGAFDTSTDTAQMAQTHDTIILTIEGLPESEVDDSEIDDSEDGFVEEQFKIFLPSARTN